MTYLSKMLFIVTGLGIVLFQFYGCVESKIQYFPDTGPQLRRISLTPTTLTLVPGQTTTLQVTLLASDSTVLPSLPLQWTVGNSEIARVDSFGNVRAVQRGRTYITASYQGVFSNTVGITVTYPPYSLDLRPDSSFLLSAGSIQLEWTVLDSLGNHLDADPTLSCSDTLIALIDPSGRVTGRNEGTAKIYATLFQLIDSVVVYVLARYDSVRITPSQLAIQLGTTAQLTCLGWLNNRVIYPTIVEWRSTQASVVSVNSQGLIFGHSIGHAYITAATGNSVSPAVMVSVEPTPPENEYLVVATEDTLWEIGSETRSKIFHFAFSDNVYDIRKHPTEKKAALITDTQQLYYCDLETNTHSSPIPAIYYEESPIAFSANGDFLLALGSNNYPISVHLPTMNVYQLSIPPGFINFKWSRLPQIGNNHWIFIGEFNQERFYLVTQFTGQWVDTTRCAVDALSPIYDVTSMTSFDVYQDSVYRCTLFNNEIQVEYLDTLRIRLRKWLTISRNQRSLLALGELNRIYQLDIPILSSDILEHSDLSNYNYLTFSPVPFEAYGSLGVQLFRLTSRYPVAFSWFSFYRPITAMDR